MTNTAVSDVAPVAGIRFLGIVPLAYPNLVHVDLPKQAAGSLGHYEALALTELGEIAFVDLNERAAKAAVAKSRSPDVKMVY